jgi:hypothetical protein
MTTRVLLAKYIRDPRRWEPINVGVVLLRGDDVRARFVGEREGGIIDGRVTRHIVGDAEVFSEWVRYWRRSLAEGASGAVDVLARKTPNYWVAEQGEVWFDGEDLSLDELTHRYFAELVLRGEDDTDATAPQLRERADRVLEQVLFDGVRVERDAIVTAAKLDPPERYKFHYRVENGHVTIGHRVSLETVHLHDALWKFSHLPDEYAKIAFVAGEEAPDELAPTLIHLTRHARVIDVLAPSAEDELRKVLES